MTSDAVIAIGCDQRITVFNAGAESIFGYTAWEVEGEPISLLIPDRLRVAHKEHIDAFLVSQDQSRLMHERREIVGRRNDGSEFFAEASIAKFEEDGEATAAVILRDISDRKEAERRLRKSADNLANAQRIARMGSWDWNIESDEFWWSDEVYRIFGTTPGDASPTYEAFLDAAYPEDRDRLASAVERSVTGGEFFQISHRIARPSGEIRHVVQEGEVVHAEAGQPVTMSGTIQDVTEQIAAREALKSSEERLQQFQKLEAVGQLTGGIAHDFNNILAIILGNLEIATERLAHGENIGKYLDLAVQGATRGTDLTKRLLTFSSRQRVASGVHDINAIVENMAEVLARTVGENIALETSLDDAAPHAALDPAQMESAILNLAINGRDAMPDGGTLRIETKLVSGKARPNGKRKTDKAPTRVNLTISDDGVGMPEEIKQRAFEPFFTTKKEGTASGLGLSMVYGFVERSGGNIEIDSAPGKGTSIKIALPLREPAAYTVSDVEDGDGQEISDDPGEGTVLVVEDERGVREVVIRYMKDLGFAVLDAGSGAEAIGLLEDHGEIDLVLSDVVLPGGIDGYEIVTTAKSLRPRIGCLLMSGYPARPESEGDTAESAVPLLRKPFERADLARLVHEVLAERSPN